MSISRYYMNLNTGDDLRNRMSHLLCHACLLRGESARNLELPDLFSVPLEHEGYTDCRALVMIMEQGKTNRFVLLALSHLIFSFDGVSRKKTFQTFWSQKGGMISTYSSQRLTPDLITYRSHYDATVKAFSAHGFHSKAKTHAARGSGSQMAELAGATESQIRRLGRWNSSSMEGCYLSALPREAMRTLAGFYPDRHTTPPDKLQREVFLFVERYVTAYAQQSAPQIATGGFLELLI
ncbi:Hypothetical protein PHPALM_16482, partial [Phytophthora palmivora]